MADILPNSLTRTPKTDWAISKLGREWLHLFCMSCGKGGCRVLRADIPCCEEFAGWVCNDCADKYGGIPQDWMVADDVFWAKVAEAQTNRESEESIAKLFLDRNTFKSSF